jgi:hypothetical protein
MIDLLWFLTSILLPILLPFLVLTPFKIAYDHEKLDKETRENTSWSAAVKDGQFCLTAIAISAATLYEVLSMTWPRPPWITVVAFAQAALMLCATAIYPFAMMYHVKVSLEKHKNRAAWFKHYKFGSLSLLICFWVALMSTFCHLGVVESQKLHDALKNVAKDIK